MLKYAAASVVLILGCAVSAPPASAAPRDDDCVNCAPTKPYDSEDAARIRREMDRAGIPDVITAAPVAERAPDDDRSADALAHDCADCPPPRRYDGTEVVKTSRDVDQSRVINTDAVVQLPPRVKEINKLIVRENETRNIGVIQHNHRIIEKETRYMKRAPVYQRRPVHHYAIPRYRAVQQVQAVLGPVAPPPVQNCGCPCTCSGAQSASASAYVYRAGYAYDAERGSMQKVWVPVAVPTGYGYR